MNTELGPISVCIIARNESATIARCLESVCDVAHEIIVVDTGSSDETPAIAHRLGARVERFTWCDDFSAARNFSLSLAAHPWILVLDGDEILAPGQNSRLHQLTAREEVFGYRCAIRNQLPDGSEFISQVVRLFRNDPRILFSGRVHEQVETSLAAVGQRAAPSDLTILHSGYARDEATNRAKAERNIKGLLLDLDAEPTNLFLAVKIGQLYLTLNDRERALEYLKRGAAISDPALAAESYNTIAGIHLSEQRFEPALRACAQSISLIQYQRMGYILLSQILRAMGRHNEANAQLLIARSMNGPTQLHADLPEVSS
ncbi:MAG: hypothetical protein RL417_1558 [Pseudomonadota bacterium]|jgi:glycosyltransferase involved in cell wall biosynthesis